MLGGLAASTLLVAALLVSAEFAGARVSGPAALSWFASTPAPGTLSVSVRGATGAGLSAPRLFVNDQLRCRKPDCKLELEPGPQFLRVEAPGYERTAAQAVQIRSGKTTHHAFKLLSSAPKRPSAKSHLRLTGSATALASSDVSPATPSASARVAQRPGVQSRPRPGEAGGLQPAPNEPELTKDTLQPTGERPPPGRLSVHSVLPVTLLLDGAPFGMTPREDVRVAAGHHTVTFVHAAHQKKSISVKVVSGASETISVEF